MNGRKFIGASILTVALMLSAAGTTNATMVGECKSLIGYTKGYLNSVVIGGGNPERTRAGRTPRCGTTR